MKNDLAEVLRNLFMSELYRCELPANFSGRIAQEFDWADLSTRVRDHVEKEQDETASEIQEAEAACEEYLQGFRDSGI